jgi:hypothetical protein
MTPNLGQNGTSTTATVLIEAHELLNHYGIRPYWPNSAYRKGEDVPAGEAADVVAHLITCESQGVSVKHLDDNGYYSYGVGQIQSSTWAEFEVHSGLLGSPMIALDAVPMMIWAVENGYLSEWSCAEILRIVA